MVSVMRLLGYTLGFMALVGCGGEAVIDPPLGSGGSSSTTSNASSSSGTVTVTISTGPGMLTCEGINAMYRSLVNEAQSCSSDIDVPQCLNQLPDDLWCPCDVWVEIGDAQLMVAIENVVDRFNARGCPDDGLPCPEIACPFLTAGDCVDDGCVDANN